MVEGLYKAYQENIDVYQESSICVRYQVRLDSSKSPSDIKCPYGYMWGSPLSAPGLTSPVRGVRREGGKPTKQGRWTVAVESCR